MIGYLVGKWRRIRWGARCEVCELPYWLNPPKDHKAWLGHTWRRGNDVR